jgi:hypothetical protein
MELIKRPEDLVLADVAEVASPILRVFDEITDRQADIGFDLRKDAHNPDPPADLHIQPLLAVGRGDPLLVDFGEVVKRERVLKALFQASDRLGEPLPEVLDEG